MSSLGGLWFWEFFDDGLKGQEAMMRDDIPTPLETSAGTSW